MKRLSSWNLESLPWTVFDPALVDRGLLALAKGASLVEANSADYVAYLSEVFRDDPEILPEIQAWGEEEYQHGAALRRWCELADPSFDFDQAMVRFRQTYRLPTHVRASVRGSRARELVARCVVETGTTTYYSALRDAAREPVLKEICRRLAGDEVRHYQLFLHHLNSRYARKDGLTFTQRLHTIWQRIGELDDPELTLAYFAANHGETFTLKFVDDYSRFYMSEVTRLYRLRHFMTSVFMLSKVLGVKLRPWTTSFVAHLIQGLFQFRYGHPRRLDVVAFAP